jgi:hypothetical protein
VAKGFLPVVGRLILTGGYIASRFAFAAHRERESSNIEWILQVATLLC